MFYNTESLYQLFKERGETIMFDKFIAICIIIMGFLFFGTIGHSFYVNTQTYKMKAIAELQRVHCDCMSMQKYLKDRKDGI